MSTDTIRYTLTREAYLAYNLYCLLQLPSIRRLLLILQFVPPLLVMAVCGVLYLMSRMTATMACLLSAMVYAVFVLFYPAVFRSLTKRRVGKMLDEGIGREFIGEHLLEMQKDCLRDTADGCVIEAPYRDVGKVVENDGHLYAFLGPAAAFVIPLPVLGSEEEKMAFLALLSGRGARFKLPRTMA